jgi:hypothetical protein
MGRKGVWLIRIPCRRGSVEKKKHYVRAQKEKTPPLADRRRARLNGCRKPWRCRLAHVEVQWTPSRSVRGGRW